MKGIDHSDIQRIRGKFGDPKNSTIRKIMELVTGQNSGKLYGSSGIGRPEGQVGTPRVRFHFGFVVNNQDPAHLGRIKVQFPQWGENFISDWMPLARPFAGTDMGIWTLPDVGEKVICSFISDNPIRVVLGFIYTPQTGIPVSDITDNNIKVFTSRFGSTIVIDDTEGEEKISVFMKEGKMALILDKAKGITVINKIKDISIKCRKLIIHAKDAAMFKFSKGLKITAQNEIEIKAGKSVNIKASGNVVVKGSKIKIKGSAGVTAQMKQIATKDDMVVGLDMHIVKIPTSGGLVPIGPLPHPHMAKIKDKCSQDVFVKDKNVAVKGSQSKTIIPHFPMPPGVVFNKNPSNKGEISNLTVSTVKVNGKEVAVIGSMVKTCNDPADQETCQVVAIGMSIALPILIPGFDPLQTLLDGGALINMRDPIAKPGPRPQDVDRSLSSPAWDKTKANIGDEVKLSVSLSGQYEGASVIFKIWKEGEDRAKVPPIKREANNSGGKAETTWRYIHIDDPAKPLTEKPKFIFVATSYRCADVETPQAAEFGAKIDLKCVDVFGKLIKNTDYKLIKSGDDGSTDGEGMIVKDSTVPGETVRFEFDE